MRTGTEIVNPCICFKVFAQRCNSNRHITNSPYSNAFDECVEPIVDETQSMFFPADSVP